MKDIETKMILNPRGGATIACNFGESMTMKFVEYAFLERVANLMAEKAVKEIWKKHGATIIKKVDKKTIGNLTVKKLTTLIASELKK